MGCPSPGPAPLPMDPGLGPPPGPAAGPDLGPAPVRPGWVRVDCHLHTVASGDAWTTLDQLAERVRECRLDVVCITDHNVTSEAVAAVQRGIGCRVIVGEEIRTPSG